MSSLSTVQWEPRYTLSLQAKSLGLSLLTQDLCEQVARTVPSQDGCNSGGWFLDSCQCWSSWKEARFMWTGHHSPLEGLYALWLRVGSGWASTSPFGASTQVCSSRHSLGNNHIRQVCTLPRWLEPESREVFWTHFPGHWMDWSLGPLWESPVTGERPWTLSKLIECDMTLEHLCACDSCPSD